MSSVAAIANTPSLKVSSRVVSMRALNALGRLFLPVRKRSAEVMAVRRDPVEGLVQCRAQIDEERDEVIATVEVDLLDQAAVAEPKRARGARARRVIQPAVHGRRLRRTSPSAIGGTPD